MVKKNALIKIKGLAANQHGRISHRTITMSLSTKKGSRFNFLLNKHADFHHPPSPPQKKTTVIRQQLFHQKVPAANNNKKQQNQQNHKIAANDTTCRRLRCWCFWCGRKFGFSVFASPSSLPMPLLQAPWGALSVGFRNSHYKRGL